jgi:hypothetical protein
MTKKMKADERWRGDEVAPEPAGSAEDKADRAEGNARISVEERRAREDAGEPAPEPPRPAPGAAPDDDDDENIREKREAAAENHREREETGQPPHGKKL